MDNDTLVLYFEVEKMKYSIRFGSSSIGSLALEQQEFEHGSLLAIFRIVYEREIPCSILHDLRTVKIQFFEHAWMYLPTFY